MTDAADFSPAELERHRAFLARLARGLTRGEAAAEDLVQEAFTRALEHPPASAFALRAWLARVLHRLAQNRARSEERSAQRERRVARPEGVSPPDEALASLELEALLVAAMRALDEPYRTTLWLRFHEGLAPREIAARLTLPVKTVEARLTRGLAALRTDLDRRSGGDRSRWLAGVLGLGRDGSVPWALPLGVGVVMKKLVVVAGVLLALFLAWRLASSSRAPSATESALPAKVAGLGHTPASSLGAAQRAAIAPATALSTSTDPHGALRVRVLWSDGTPAPGIGLFLFPEDDPLGARQVLRERTGDDGVVLVESIHAGRVRVEADRGGERAATLEAGRETEVVLELPLGVDVQGTVSDEAPLAGAEILLDSGSDDWLATRVVALTGADGTYRVRSVDPRFSVSARAGDYAPAHLEPLQGRAPAGGTVSLDFFLGLESLGLRGIVLDPERHAVAGALVAVGDPGGYFQMEEGLGHAVRGLALVETDLEGHFDAHSVEQAHGSIPVAVLAAGFPVKFTSVAGGLGEEASVEVVLDRPGTLVGSVRDPVGAPVGGARLAVLSLDGTAARDVSFPLPSAVCAADGAYRLELVPPGKLTIRAEPPSASSLGNALATLEVAPGEGRLDLTLTGDDTIRGRVENDLGGPVGHRALRWTRQNGGEATQRMETGSDGRFEIPHCKAPPYTLEVLDERMGRRPLLVVRDVGPSSEELVLRLERPASLTGTFVDEAACFSADERPSGFLVQRNGDYGADPEWSEGSFRFDELAPGAYRFVLRTKDQLVLSTDWITLAAGEQRDLGVLRSERPGKVVLEFETFPERYGAALLDARYGVAAFVELENGALVVPAVPPGEYTLDVHADGQARIAEPVLVRAGETARVRLAFEPGIERTLTFPLARGARWDDVRILVRNVDGRLHLLRRLEQGDVEGTPSVLVSLPPGTFHVVAETDTGLRAEGSFTVSGLVAQDAPLAFELR